MVLAIRTRLITSSKLSTSFGSSNEAISITDILPSRWLAETAHANGLAIGLKNSGELLSSWEKVPTRFQKDLVAAFDFSVIESCVRCF